MIFIPGNDDGMVQAAAASVQVQQAQQAAIVHLIEATAIQIYAQRLGKGAFSEVHCRDAAKFAISAAPFLAEVMGKIKIANKDD